MSTHLITETMSLIYRRAFMIMIMTVRLFKILTHHQTIHQRMPSNEEVGIMAIFIYIEFI